MNEAEIKTTLESGEAKPVAILTEPLPPPEKLDDLAPFLEILMRVSKIMRHVTAVPTYVPKNWIEQFCFYQSGGDIRLYAYVNRTWRYVTLT